MDCPSELTRCRYADGELTTEQADSIEHHLLDCGQCRLSVESLVAEGHVIRAAVQAIDVTGEIPLFSPRPSVVQLLSWIGLLALTAWTVNLAWASLTTAVELPGWLGWLAPDSTSVAIDLAVGLMGQLAGEGSLMLNTVQSAAGLAVIGIGWAAVWLLIRRKIDQVNMLGFQFGLLMALLMLIPAPVHAIEIRRDENLVVIPAGEVIDDTLIVSAEKVVVEGTVSGDLMVFGEQVTVLGKVGGVLLSGAESLTIEGEIAGTVLAMGETVDIRAGIYATNLIALGSEVTVHEGAEVGGNVALAANEAEMHGRAGRDLLAGARKLILFGDVDGNLNAYAERVDLVASARLGGDLKARVKNADSLQVAEGATVEGTTELTTWPVERNRYATFGFYLSQTLQLLAAFVFGLVMFNLFPALSQSRLDNGSAVLAAMGFGAVALIATPILAVVVALTLIGAPLGILTFLLWLVAYYAAGIVVAGYVGRMLLDDQAGRSVLPLLLGLGIFFVLTNVPILGGILRLLATIVGLGLIVQWLRDLWETRAA